MHWNICFWRRSLALAVLIWCLALAHPVFAESADSEGQQKEQWVFLLADPEDDASCTFYAKPSLAGYETGECTEIMLAMAIGGKNYEIELYPSEGTDGWYISGSYSIAGDAWKMDYEAKVQMIGTEGVLAEEDLSNKEMSAQWPEVRERKLELTFDREGRLEKNEFEWDQWIEKSDSPLFTYKTDTQTDCIVHLKQDIIIIEKAADGGSFNIAVSDPSGNRRIAQVDIIVANQAGKGAIIGIGAVIVILLIVGVVWVLKKKRDGSSAAGKEDRGGGSASGSGVTGGVFAGNGRKIQEIVEVRKEVDEVRQRLDRLVRQCRTRKAEILDIRGAAEARVKSDGQSSAYSLEYIEKTAACADELETNVGYVNLRPMVDTLKNVSDDLLKMQGRQKTQIRKDAGETAVAKNYLDAEKREEYFEAISADEPVLAAWLARADAALQALREISDYVDKPYEKNIEIFVHDGTMEYKGRRVARGTYGLPQPGVFALDEVKLLGKDGSWRTLPDILGHATEIRMFSKAEKGIRVVADQPVFKADGERTNILEFAYEQEAHMTIDGAEITLQFK